MLKRIPVPLAVLLILGAGIALAQVVTNNPPPAGMQYMGCVYNSSPASPVSGSGYYVQCDASGSIITAGGVPTTGADNADARAAVATGLVKVVNSNYCWNGATWDRCTGLTTGTAGSASTSVVTIQGILSGTPVPVSATQYPQAATVITGIGTGTTGAVVGTLAAASSKTTYICGFDVSATGGVATIGPITIAGLIGGTFTYQLFSTATGANLSRTFTPCIPASTTNTAIVITTTADATASAVDVNSWGFQQ